MALAPALFISPVGNAEVRVAGQRGAGSPLPDEDGRYMDCVEVSCLRLLEALGARPRDEARDGAEPPPLAPEEVAAELATDLLSAAQLSPVFEPGVVFDISALEARGASAEVVDFMRARHGARRSAARGVAAYAVVFPSDEALQARTTRRTRSTGTRGPQGF